MIFNEFCLRGFIKENRSLLSWLWLLDWILSLSTRLVIINYRLCGLLFAMDFSLLSLTWSFPHYLDKLVANLDRRLLNLVFLIDHCLVVSLRYWRWDLNWKIGDKYLLMLYRREIFGLHAFCALKQNCLYIFVYFWVFGNGELIELSWQQFLARLIGLVGPIKMEGLFMMKIIIEFVSLYFFGFRVLGSILWSLKQVHGRFYIFFGYSWRAYCVAEIFRKILKCMLPHRARLCITHTVYNMFIQAYHLFNTQGNRPKFLLKQKWSLLNYIIMISIHCYYNCYWDCACYCCCCYYCCDSINSRSSDRSTKLDSLLRTVRVN